MAFQAEREFTALGGDAALDFVPISGDRDTPNQVLALALNSSGLAEARDACKALGVEPDRIPLRACAAAAFVFRAGVISADKLALVINPLTDEADLAVQSGDRVVLMRTLRLPEPAQSEARQRALLSEIRRTMAAVRQQFPDQKVELAVVCGTPTQVDGEGLAEELDLPVQVFDPASHAPSSLDKLGLPAESVSRFAAVLGMALNEADRRPPIVDFANVRRQAEKRRFTRAHALAAAAAAVAILWFAAHLWRQISDPARELATLEPRIQHLQAQADMYEEVTAQAAAIERWLATDVNWLDELEQFARRVRPQPLSAEEFPVDDDVVVTQLTMLRPPGVEAAGGRIDLEAKAKNFTAIRDLEHRLRNEQRRVTPGGVRSDDSVSGYQLALDLQVHVPPPSDDGDEGKDAEAAP